MRVIDEANARLREVNFRHNDHAVGVDLSGKVEVRGARVFVYVHMHAL